MDELPLNIPLSSLLDYVQCSICMLDLTSTVVTPCGHRFCSNCIKEWIDRQKKCPCCNAPVSEDKLIKDHQYDALIAVILKGKDVASAKYFEHLLTNVTTGNHDKSIGNHEGSIEAVLQKHLLPSLSAHKRYCERMNKEYEARLRKLEESKTRDLAALDNAEDGVDEKTSEIERTFREQSETIKKELTTCVELVARAYDRHLSKCMPPVDLLPIEVSVYILEKDVRITNVLLKPRDCGSVIWDVIKRTMADRDDPIVRSSDDVRMLVFGPFAKSTQAEMRLIAKDVTENGNTNHPDVIVVKERTRLVLELGVKPSSEVVLYGNLVCESDLPPRCFTQMCDDKHRTVDYFSCNDCSINWICRACMSVCHKDHDTAPYIMNHQPTWACCYCPKKKKCQIVDKNK